MNWTDRAQVASAAINSLSSAGIDWELLQCGRCSNAQGTTATRSYFGTGESQTTWRYCMLGPSLALFLLGCGRREPFDAGRSVHAVAGRADRTVTGAL